MRGKNHEKKIDTGKFFPKKTRKATTKTVPASAAYAPTIHGKYMQFLSPETAKDISIYHNLKHKKHPCKPAIANDFKLYETNRGKGSTNGRGAILLYKHCSQSNFEKKPN